MEQTLARIALEVKNNLNLTEDKDGIVKRYVKRAVGQVLIFCSRKDIPSLLEDVIAQMVEDMLKADGKVEVPAEVSSITRGDTSISYKDKSSALKDTTSFMKNYQGQLVTFKKMKLPEESV